MRFVSEICELVLKTLVPNERVTLVGGGRAWQDVAEDGGRAALGRRLGGSGWRLGGSWVALGGSWAALRPKIRKRKLGGIRAILKSAQNEMSLSTKPTSKGSWGALGQS